MERESEARERAGDGRRWVGRLKRSKRWRKLGLWEAMWVNWGRLTGCFYPMFWFVVNFGCGVVHIQLKSIAESTSPGDVLFCKTTLFF